MDNLIQVATRNIQDAQETERRAYRVLCEQRAKDCTRVLATASGYQTLLARRVMHDVHVTSRALARRVD